MHIGNDKEFKAALETLSIPRQRRVAARFAQLVADLSDDVRVRAAIDAASREAVSEAELEVLYKAANSARVESLTRCGADADWCDQTAHFVAKAATACVRPATAAGNLAWDAAMHARIAATFAALMRGEGTDTRIAEQQYRILEAYLNE